MNPSPNRLISLSQARAIIDSLGPLADEETTLTEALGRITADPVRAAGNCPTVDSSLKDGYAVRSCDVAAATAVQPVSLVIAGTVVAGAATSPTVAPGTAVRIMTGAPLPAGADAVLAAEFATERDRQVEARANAHAGRNVLRAGSDVSAGEIVTDAGTLLGPGHLGLFAAAGITRVSVVRRPRIMVAAIGSELVEPGQPIGPGQVAASNLVTIRGELQRIGLETDGVLLTDQLDRLESVFAAILSSHDVLITCGGVLDGDKDLTLQAMDRLGVQRLFHRVRIGPGKGIAMGRIGTAVIFNLPGGPPSNHVAFRQLALPGIRKLAGYPAPFIGRGTALLTETVRGARGWTQFIYGRMLAHNDDGSRHVQPLTGLPRLQTMAAADCLIELPEELDTGAAGAPVTIWLF